MYYTKKGSSMLQAHRGVNAEFPENTMIAYEAAVKQGYDLIELDPNVTADGEVILFHDLYLNRTARNADGTKLLNRTYVDSLTLSQIKELDAGSYFSSEFKGEKIPTFAEVLELAVRNKIPIKVDNKIQSFREEALNRIFGLVKEYEAEDLVQFTFSDLNFMDYFIKQIPKAHIHYDGYVDRWLLDQVQSILISNPLTVWLRYDNKTSKWSKMPPANAERAELAKKYGNVGIWILEEKEEADIAVDVLGADLIETTGSIKPNSR